MINETIKKPKFLEFFPLTLYASVTSLGSMSVAWGFIKGDMAATMKVVLGLAAVIMFSLLTIIFLFKLSRYPQLVKKDYDDPVGINLFGVFFISLMSVSGIVNNYNPQLALILWVTGTVLTAAFSLLVFNRWMDHRQEPSNALPLWLIPVLGMLDIPLTGLHFQMPVINEVCIAFYVAGLLFAGILITVIFSRLLFQQELPSPAKPTLLLLVAPFAISFAVYEQLTGRQDLVAALFFYGAVFMFVLFGQKIAFCLIRVQFTVTWWSISFPTAALTVATLRYASHTNLYFVKLFADAMVVLSMLIIVVLFLQTIYYIIAHFIISACPQPKSRMTLTDLMHRHRM
jgi:tellurite resistance protein